MPIHSCNPYLTPPILSWIATFNNPASVYLYEIGVGVDTDSNDNVYVSGWTSYSDDWLAKFDSTGNLVWQRIVGTGNNEGHGITVSASGDVYVTGQVGGGIGAGGTDAYLIKYNTSGVLQWQRALGNASNNYGEKVALDSSDNVYVCGWGNSQGGLVAKYNSSGVIQWQQESNGTDSYRGIAVDSVGGAYVVGSRSTHVIPVLKYNSSGVLQWERELTNVFAGSDNAYDCATDTSDNLFLVGITTQTGTSSNAMFIAKYNSSGVLQWQRVLDATSADYAWTVDTDSVGNAYMVGTEYGGDGVLIAKYDTSGVIQWQRTFGGSGSDTSYGAAIDSTDNLVFAGRIDYNDAFIMKVPSDGTKTGVYSANGYSVTYAASSFTEVAGQLTDSAGIVGSSVGTLTDQSVVMVDDVATYDATLLPIP